jgi:nucleoside-diphosphate-sugar epimerase
MAIIALMAMLLLTGATGFLGSWILERMRQEETCRKLGFDTLRLMVRRPERLAQAPLPGTRLEVRQGDLLEPESVRSAVQAADAVLHVAALYDTHSPWRAFYRSNVEATRALVSGMRAGSSLVLTSTYGVYGFPNAGRPITEDYEPKRPLWHYQRTKWLQEQEARALCRERGIRFVALRPPTVIGPREMLSIPSLARTIESGRLVLVGDGSNTVAFAHAADAARAHLLALARVAENDGEAFHFASFHATFRQYVDAFAAALGAPPVRRQAPLWLARFIGALGDLGRGLGFPGAYTSFTVAYAASDDVLDDRRIRERLGFAPAYDLQRTVQESVAWYLQARPRGR